MHAQLNDHHTHTLTPHIQVDVNGQEPDKGDPIAVWRSCSVTEWALWFGMWVTPRWLQLPGDDVRRPCNALPGDFDAQKQRCQLALYGWNQREVPERLACGGGGSPIDLTQTASPAWNANSPTAKRMRVRQPC